MKETMEKFKPGDIVYFTSSYLKCSCLTKIVSIVGDRIIHYKLDCILYNCGVGSGKNYDYGCPEIDASDSCAGNSWKVSQPCYEFLKLFMNEDVRKKAK